MTLPHSWGGLSTDKLYRQTLLTNFTDKLYRQTLLTNFTDKLYRQTLFNDSIHGKVPVILHHRFPRMSRYRNLGP